MAHLLTRAEYPGGPSRRTDGGQRRLGWPLLSRPPAAEGGGRRPAFTAAASPATLSPRGDGPDARGPVLERGAAVRMLQNSATTRERMACRSECSDGICRLFLCSRCRVQVFVCRRCDRGQIYCFGACAQEARRERRREARRRYQATDRGRALHAERSRRYRARRRCVTDHGPLATGPERRLRKADTALSNPPRGSPLCHRCSRSASEFVRLSALRRRYVGHRRRRFGHPP
jgi:hypothetical protein